MPPVPPILARPYRERLRHELWTPSAGLSLLRSACFRLCLRRWSQAVLALPLVQLPGDGEPHQGADDILLRMAVRQGRDDGSLRARDAVPEELEDGWCRARHH